MNIDWSNAPSEATHAAGSNCFYRYQEQWLLWCKDEWIKSSDWEDWSVVPQCFVARPSKWKGEGLPDLGIECMVQHPGQLSRKVKILAHWVDNLKVPVAVYMPLEGKACCDQAIAECFKPIRMPEQIAEEERERVIDEMVSVVMTDNIRSNCADLYDAGYRKREVLEEK